MHLGKFHDAIGRLITEYNELHIHVVFGNLVASVDQISQLGGNDEIVNNFKKFLEILRQTLGRATLNHPSPTLAAMLESINAPEFIGDKLFQRVENAIENSGMSPQLAGIAVAKLFEEVSDYYRTIDILYNSLMKLDVEREALQPGEGEIGINIPTPAQPRLLRDLASITKKWDQTLAPFVEIFDPKNDPIEVRTISSSDWQLYLVAAVTVLSGLSEAISRINDILRGIIETRQLLDQLRGKGASSEALQPLVDETDTRLHTEARALAEDMVNRNRSGNENTDNERKTKLTISLKFIARQMEANVSIEVKYLPPSPQHPGDDGSNDTDEAIYIADLKEISEQIERNMDLIRLDSESTKMLNLPPPANDEEKHSSD